MADKPKEPTPEEKARDVAMKNLKAANLINVAAAYIVHKSGKFGEAGDGAVSQYKYFPAFNSGMKAYDDDGTEFNVLQNSILGSREDGQLYSGNVSEMKIMKDCSAIVQESLARVKIADVMALMGSKAKVKDAYLSSLLPPKMSKEDAAKLTPEQKKAYSESGALYEQIIGSYQTYLAQTTVASALGEAAKEIPKGLEKLLVVPDKESPKK